jgi:hypothetical protein
VTIVSKKETSMLQKGKRQGAGFPNSLQAAFNCCDYFIEIF